VANVALADLLISGLVIPASAVVILSGLQDSPPVCQFQWFLSILCCLVTVLTMAAVAAENYVRLCLTPECYAKLTVTKITTLLFAIWIVSSILVTLQFIYKLGPDYCAKRVRRVRLYFTLNNICNIRCITFVKSKIKCLRRARKSPW
jgi:hypothetical protein